MVLLPSYKTVFLVWAVNYLINRVIIIYSFFVLLGYVIIVVGGAISSYVVKLD